MNTFGHRDQDHPGVFASLVLKMWVGGLIAVSTLFALAHRDAERRYAEPAVVFIEDLRR